MKAALQKLGASLATALAALAAPAAALAQTARPFAVGGGEGGGGANGGIAGWLIEAQSRLTHAMSLDLRALNDNPAAMWTLIGVGIVYGIVHAAGPGHGKAVIASYMLADERSLKRGVLLSLLAALLQAMVAIGLVGAAALIFHATAREMNRAASAIEFASYAAVAAIGAGLVWRKGGALIAAFAGYRERRRALAAAPVIPGVAWASPAPAFAPARFDARAPDDPRAAADAAACGHAHTPDPSTLGGRLTLRHAVGAVVAAGFRPCSGAILMLVFALAQGAFAAGIAATLAMALGTAATTAALASLAVYAKTTALRFAAGEDARVALLARGFEFAAAAAVLVFGLALMVVARAGA